MPWYLQKTQAVFFYLVILFLPTQLGKHFFPSFSYVSGIRVDYLSPTVYFTDVLIFLLFVTTLFKKPLFVFRDIFRVNTTFVLGFVFLVVGVLLSKNQEAGTYGLFKIVEFLFFGFYTARKINNLKTSALLFSVGIIFESFLAVWQFLLQHSIGGVFYWFGERTFFGDTPGIANVSLDGQLLLRPYGTFSHPNVLAGFLVIAMTFVFFQKKNRFFLITLFFGTCALFLTLSRVAILVWICEVIFLFVKKNKGGFLVNKRKIAYAIVGFFLIVLFVFSPFRQRFFDGNLGGVSLVEREQQMLASLRMSFDHPIFGVGVNNYFNNSQYYLTSKSVLQLQPVHNIYLLLLAQTGVFIFLFTALFLKKTFQKISKAKPDVRRAFFVLFFLVFSLGLFDHYLLTMQQGQLLTAFVLGVFWSKNTIKFSIKSS